MKKLVLLIFALNFLALAYAQRTPWRKDEMEVRIQLKQAGDARRLATFNYSCDIYLTSALAYLVPSELEAIKNAGFDYQVLKPDLNAWSASFGPALVPPGYYTFQQIRNIADSLATHFPAICKKVIYGYTAQMQELAALKISDNVTVDEAEPEILFDGGIHGDEVGGSQNVIQFARDLCLGYGNDIQITGLVDSREIWLYYCVNPWGRDNMTRNNSASVDINRDNGYMWGDEGGSPGPFSQPETKALRKCQYENQFVSYTNYHSGTEIISYPWSYRLSPAPDALSFEHLAQVYAAASGYSGLQYGQGSVIMYLIQGSTKDFNYGSLGSVAWSIEISMDKQPPEVQYYYDINKPAMLALIENAGYGIQGMITDAITGKPVNAAIYAGANYPVYSDGEVGDYHKYMSPGSYSIKVDANGYESKTIDNVVVNDLQCTTVDIQLDPVASQFGYRVITSRIPNFNAQNPGDEGYTAACLGPPDQVNYSLGRGGYIILDMQDTIFDGEPGSFDIIVYEGDATPEGYTLYAGSTMDGPWTNIGYGIGTMSFNMGLYGVTEARYFMLLDDNDGPSNVNDAGFDFDAIACNHPSIPDTVGHVSGYAYDAFTHQPLAGIAITSGDSTVLTDTTGFYSIELLRGTKEICANAEGYRTECDTLNLMAGSAYVNDFYLFPTVGLQDRFLASSEIRVSPNPFITGFSVQFSLPVGGQCIIELSDLTGSNILTLVDRYFTPGNHLLDIYTHLLPMGSLSPGCYILTISALNKHFSTKVIKAS